MKILRIAIALLYFSTVVNAQFHQAVFPNLDGTQLLEETVKAFKPNSVLDYGPARDTMYATIYNEKDSVKGIYTNHAVFLPKGVDPSVAIFMGGSANGINAEHTYPQSKGARDGNAKSDMHHLFPSKTPVNSDRGSLEFKDIPDSQTTAWYYKTTKRSGIPAGNIDLYSEGTATAFEPSENKKGNIARAMFYFYTMYQQQADAADPSFFENQRLTLCEWHQIDPVDSLEWVRTFQIAKHQDSKANPFVLDCSLAARSYCPLLLENCNMSNSSTQFLQAEKTLNIYPNPASEQFNVQFSTARPGKVQFNLFDSFGRKIISTNPEMISAGEQQFSLHTFGSIFMILEVVISNSKGKESFRRKVFLLK